MTRRLALFAALAALCMPAAASAQEPPQLVAGANSKWISGSLLSQTGLNCSVAIIGNSYTEIMVSGIASYGGAPSGGIPKVGEPYWTAFLVSIPGNPCGPGSSSVVTTLILPPSTQVDQTAGRQIQCYGMPRNQSGWQNLTNASWSFLGQSGPYCANQPTVSPYHQGGQQIGFRPLASGQMFWIFVPVKSSAPLIGAGGPSPGHGFTWMTDATGVYANPGRSFVWANVVQGGGGAPTAPFVYFSRDPTVIPFWKDDAPNDPNNNNITTKSRAEWFADLYSAGKAGNFCWQLDYGPAISAPIAIDSCASGFPGWNGAITTAGDLWQVFGDGPNGGYSPLYYDDDPPNTQFTLRWKFIPTDGSGQVFKDTTFRTLAGPDQDGDGVANNGTDACPEVKGTLPNGCLPAAQPDPDKDGVYGGSDACPDKDGKGALNGCPTEIIPPVDPPVLGGVVGVKRGALLKGSALAKGAVVKFTCTVDSAAAGTLSITGKIAKRLRITTKKKNLVVASGRGSCRAAGGGSLKLKVLRAYARKLRRARKLPGSLAVKLTAPGQTPVTMKQSVKFG